MFSVVGTEGFWEGGFLPPSNSLLRECAPQPEDGKEGRFQSWMEVWPTSKPPTTQNPTSAGQQLPTSHTELHTGVPVRMAQDRHVLGSQNASVVLHTAACLRAGWGVGGGGDTGSSDALHTHPHRHPQHLHITVHLCMPLRSQSMGF